MSAPSPEAIHARLAAALNAGDRDTFVDLYEPDATLVVPPEGLRACGRDAIRIAVEPTFALEPVADMAVVGKLEGDGLALTHGRWRLVGAAGDQRVELSGRGTIVSRRQPDGGWRIVLDDPLTPVSGAG